LPRGASGAVATADSVPTKKTAIPATITWNTYREPTEFVESIPFTETRDYVQAVLRNADIYRRLYR